VIRARVYLKKVKRMRGLLNIIFVVTLASSSATAVYEKEFLEAFKAGDSATCNDFMDDINPNILFRTLLSELQVNSGELFTRQKKIFLVLLNRSDRLDLTLATDSHSDGTPFHTFLTMFKGVDENRLALIKELFDAFLRLGAKVDDSIAQIFDEQQSQFYQTWYTRYKDNRSPKTRPRSDSRLKLPLPIHVHVSPRRLDSSQLTSRRSSRDSSEDSPVEDEKDQTKAAIVALQLIPTLHLLPPKPASAPTSSRKDDEEKKHTTTPQSAPTSARSNRSDEGSLSRSSRSTRVKKGRDTLRSTQSEGFSFQEALQSSLAPIVKRLQEIGEQNRRQEKEIRTLRMEILRLRLVEDENPPRQQNVDDILAEILDEPLEFSRPRRPANVLELRPEEAEEDLLAEVDDRSWLSSSSSSSK